MSVETELAWAAGFFDGEGTVYTTPCGTNIRLGVGQCDRRPLDRFAAALEIGKINGPYPKKNPNHRPIHFWQVSGEKAIASLRKLWPYLSEPKREQIKSLSCVKVERLDPDVIDAYRDAIEVVRSAA